MKLIINDAVHSIYVADQTYVVTQLAQPFTVGKFLRENFHILRKLAPIHETFPPQNMQLSQNGLFNA